MCRSPMIRKWSVPCRLSKRCQATTTDRSPGLQEPLPTFGGETALQLIAEGRSDTVLRYLASIASGFVG